MSRAPLILSAGIADARASDPARATQLIALAGAAGLDMLMLGDGGRAPFDPLVLAGWLAPRAGGVALVPTVATGRDLPFHVARALSALDFLTGGLCGWQASARAFPIDSDDAPRGADFIAATRSLWDSWDGDALIIDQAGGRYLDRNKVRRNDYRGRFFQTLGALNAARPPQGHPPLVLDAADPIACELAPDLLIADEAAPTGARLLLRVRLSELDAARLAALHCDGRLAGVHLELTDPLADLAAFTDGALAQLVAAGLIPRRREPGTLRHRLGLARARHAFQGEPRQ